MSLPPPESVARNPAAPLWIVISAPSGGGKTTLCQQLLARHPEMTRAITCTTRAPRPGERAGADYHFLDSAAFARRVAAGDFLEHATVYGHSYGTPRSEVLERLRQGKDVLLNVDVQGASTICANAVKDLDLWRALVTVFLTPPSLAGRAAAPAGDRQRGRLAAAPERGARRDRALAEFSISHRQHHYRGRSAPHGVHPRSRAHASGPRPPAGMRDDAEDIFPRPFPGGAGAASPQICLPVPGIQLPMQCQPYDPGRRALPHLAPAEFEGSFLA